LKASSGAVEAKKPVDKTVPTKQEESIPAEEEESAAVEAAKPVEKAVPIPQEKIATDDDSADKAKGRLLPWEPDAPTENSDSSDKEVPDR